MRRLALVLPFASLLAAAPALAQTQTQTQAETQVPAPAASNLTANVTLTTNYKVRGQDQDQLGHNGYNTRGFKPAIQGGFDYAFGDSGFYVGNWNSSVNWLPGASAEVDFFGGYKFKGGPIDWDAGIITYTFPGNAAGNTTELYGSGSWSDADIGSFTLKYNHVVSRDYINYAGAKGGSGLSGRHTGYLNLTYLRPIMPSLNLKVSVGYTRMSKDIRSLGYASYVDYNVGGVYDFGSGLSLSASVQGANKQSAYQLETPDGGFQSINKPRLIFALTKTL